jgi:glycosyltransferase 2 family protein
MYVLALAALVWVFHDVHPQRLLATMVIKDWWYLAVAVAVDILTYALQGARWSLLLLPVGKLRPIKATQAIYAGLFTNEILPLRLGEVVRAYLASRWVDAGVSSVVPSMLVERLLDGLWLSLGIAYAATVVPLPGKLVDAGGVLAAIVVLAAGVFVWIVYRRERKLEHGEQSHSRSGLESATSKFAAGIAAIGISRRLFVAALLSGGMLLCQGLAAWFMMLSLGIKLPLSAAATVMIIVRLGTSIPNAPANAGSFQFFTVLAMGLFGVDKTMAAGYSLVDFFVLTTPLWLLGLAAVWQTGMSFSSLRKAALGYPKSP